MLQIKLIDSKSLYNNLSISTNRTVTIADFVNTNELIIFAMQQNLTITLPNASLLRLFCNGNSFNGS
jgi:hypothetical protein